MDGSYFFLFPHRINQMISRGGFSCLFIIFKSKNEDLLYKVVVELLQDVSLCQSLSYNAVATMREIWSPRNAASSLIELSNSIIKNCKNSILAGPCSKA